MKQLQVTGKQRLVYFELGESDIWRWRYGNIKH